MNKIVVLLSTLMLLATGSFAQTENHIRPSSFGISFIFDDYTTAQRIRTTALSSVLNNKQWAKLKEMSPGLAISYFQGLGNNIDFAGTLAGAFVDDAVPGRPSSDNAFLTEADASLNFKMFSDKYFFTPYFSAGIGASKYKGYFGAFTPLGGGIKLNFFDEAALYINAKYHIPVTNETSDYHFVYSLGIAGIIGKKKEQPLKEVN